MKLGKVLSSLLGVALVVGFFSGAGGWLLGYSEMVKKSADLIDIDAELFYNLGADNSARDMRDLATEMRDMAREYHDYGIYFFVGAVLVTVVEAAWIVWKFRKAEESAFAPTPGATPPSEIPPMK